MSTLYFRPNGSQNIIAVKIGPGDFWVLPVGGVANGPITFDFTQQNPYIVSDPNYAIWQAADDAKSHAITAGDGKLNPPGTVILGRASQATQFGAAKPWWIEYAETYPPETTLTVDPAIRPDLVARMTRQLAFNDFPKGMLMVFNTPTAMLPEGVVVT